MHLFARTRSTFLEQQLARSRVASSRGRLNWTPKQLVGKIEINSGIQKVLKELHVSIIGSRRQGGMTSQLGRQPLLGVVLDFVPIEYLLV
jgi:hypothetical protein